MKIEIVITNPEIVDKLIDSLHVILINGEPHEIIDVDIDTSTYGDYTHIILTLKPTK